MRFWQRAKGYLLKDVSVAELAHAVRRVFAGETVLSVQLLRKIPESAHEEPVTPTEETPPLGGQQKRVLAQMTKGLTNPEITEQIGVSISTVRYYVSAILRKLEVSNRSEAVALAVRSILLRQLISKTTLRASLVISIAGTCCDERK